MQLASNQKCNKHKYSIYSVTYVQKYTDTAVLWTSFTSFQYDIQMGGYELFRWIMQYMYVHYKQKL